VRRSLVCQSCAPLVALQGQARLAHVLGGRAASFVWGRRISIPRSCRFRRVYVDGFWMDPLPVSVGEFRRFVELTGYITVAARPPHPAECPEAELAARVAGSAVFEPTCRPVALDSMVWWRYVPGACWHAAEGPGSDLSSREEHPVTHVAYDPCELGGCCGRPVR
jgi:sulfatase modifying factor 1